MESFSKDEIQARKEAVFKGMSPRRQKHILKKGYKKWDPFQDPQDPIDIRKDKTRQTSKSLISKFLQSIPEEKNYSNEYGRGALEMCLGIINKDEKITGMFDFACWYSELLKKEKFIKE